MRRPYSSCAATLFTVLWACVAVLSCGDLVNAATIEITMGQISVSAQSDFEAKGGGSLSGPDFAMFFPSHIGFSPCPGPCASIISPATTLGDLSTTLVLSGGFRGGFPGFDFSSQGTGYEIVGTAFLRVSTPTVALPPTSRSISAPFTLEGPMQGQNLRTGALENFDVIGAGTETVGLLGLPATGIINSVSLTFQPVPEPSTWLLLGNGLLGLAALRRIVDKREGT